MPRRSYDERLDELDRKEEQLKAERSRLENEKREFERREQSKRRMQLGTIAQNYGFEPASLESLLEKLASTDEGVSSMERAGAVRTKRWNRPAEFRSPEVPEGGDQLREVAS